MGIIDRRGDDNDAEGPHDPADDVDPRDLPEEEKVIYELGGWSLNLQAMASEALADAGIPHSWSGTDMIVADRHERKADRVLEEVEQAGRAAGEKIEEGDEARDDVPTPSPAGRETEYDLEELGDETRTLLTDRLDE